MYLSVQIIMRPIFHVGRYFIAYSRMHYICVSPFCRMHYICIYILARWYSNHGMRKGYNTSKLGNIHINYYRYITLESLWPTPSFQAVGIWYGWYQYNTSTWCDKDCTMSGCSDPSSNNPTACSIGYSCVEWWVGCISKGATASSSTTTWHCQSLCWIYKTNDRSTYTMCEILLE